MSKVVLITGASSGLGLAIAGHLVSKGYIVYGSSRSIKEGGYPFKPIVMDVCDNGSISNALSVILKEQGRLDVVVNNAGLGIAGPVEHLEQDNVQKVFDTNILGPLRVSQAVLPVMRKQHSGKIINISSIGSEFGLPYRGAYSASKAALDRLTEALRMEVKKFGIQACTVQPGGIITDINKNRLISPQPGNSAYKESFDRTYQIINDSVQYGLSVEKFGPVIEKIIESPIIKRNYRIGKFNEKLSVLVKRLVPDFVFEKIITSHYKI